MTEISELNFNGGIIERIRESPVHEDEVILWWLGQAGFAFRFRNKLGLIDPYLSDYLAKKYKDTAMSHTRLMAIPLRCDEVRDLDLVFCTHRHLDHMDPETLTILSKNNPSCMFLIPKAEVDWAIETGLPENRIQGVDAGESLSCNSDIKVEILASAHEDIKVNERGEHHFLGFILRFGDICIYHSGDCVPYKGLEKKLKNAAIDIALLPVNGRDERRRKLNILGNFTFQEAVKLCQNCNIPYMIAHHFGMFAFNTVDAEEIRGKIEGLKDDIICFLPLADIMYLISK